MDYDLVIFIGRFQPFHNIHEEVLREAYNYADDVLVLLGSPQEYRTPKNPWKTYERARMVENVVDGLASDEAGVVNGKRTFIDMVPDHPDDTEWKSFVVDSVEDVLFEMGFPRASDARVALIGGQKDSSGFWLTMFPEYDLIPADIRDGYSGTDIRKMYREGNDFWTSLVPTRVRHIMNEVNPHLELSYDAI